MLTLPADPLTALQQQCAGIVRDNNRCTPRVAAGLAWLTKGLEQHYGPLVMERAKTKFTEVHGLPVNELLLMKAYFVRFQSWDNGDWWIADKYLDCLESGTPLGKAYDTVLATVSGYAARPAIIRFINAFWDARQLAIEAQRAISLNRFTKEEDED